MITLKNEDITVKISEIGAELKSLICNDTEYIWEGRKEVWAGSCPLLFPICGGLKDDKYILNGREYILEKHGYARFKTFEVESKTDTNVVFLHKSDSDTKKQFPFDYELRVIYALDQKKLKIDYSVKNMSDKKKNEMSLEQELSIEESFEKLEELLDKTESEDTGLEESFKLYEEGLKILKNAEAGIDKVEKKINIVESGES